MMTERSFSWGPKLLTSSVSVRKAKLIFVGQFPNEIFLMFTLLCLFTHTFSAFSKYTNSKYLGARRYGLGSW